MKNKFTKVLLIVGITVMASGIRMPKVQAFEVHTDIEYMGISDTENLTTEHNYQEVIEQVMKEISECKGDLALVDFPVCNECGRILGFNQISTPGYREDGYLPMWNKYMKWLQGTINRNVCILELGAGMEYPSVIRFPFEKLAFFNQKAVFYRVHSWLYQMTEELKEKGISVNQNPIDFVLNEGIKE